MNIKQMRSIHLYLGVFFAPLMLFFIISGAAQTFHLHEASKAGYRPPVIVESLAEVHIHQRWAGKKEKAAPSVPFRYFVLLMSAGMAATTVLGILMALKYTRPAVVWSCLAAGVLVPGLLIVLALGQRGSPAASGGPQNQAYKGGQ